MSAYLCSDSHIAVCALAASTSGLTKKSTRSLMSAFRSINNMALKHRYGDKPVSMQYSPELLANAEEYLRYAPKVNIQGMFSCLVYQCSEGDTLETHKASKVLLSVSSYYGNDHSDEFLPL